MHSIEIVVGHGGGVCLFVLSSSFILFYVVAVAVAVNVLYYYRRACVVVYVYVLLLLVKNPSVGSLLRKLASTQLNNSTQLNSTRCFIIIINS
jgi:hypothetical protein